MPTFRYTASDSAGKVCEGTVVANNRTDALHQIRELVLTPISLSHSLPKRGNYFNRVRHEELAACFSALADLLASGMPLLRALDLVAANHQRSRLGAALLDVKVRVSDGSALAEALRCHPGVFSQIATSIVEVGEESGCLEECFEQLGKICEQQSALKARVIGALTYPAFLLLMGVVVTLGMFLYFVPIFEPLFERLQLRGELPIITQVLLASSAAARAFWAPCLSAVLLASIVFVQYFRTDAGRLRVDRWKLNSKLVGPLAIDLALTRLAATLGTLTQAGVPLVRAIRLSQQSVGNRHLAALLAEAQEHVIDGRPLAIALRDCAAIPNEFTQKVAIAEQSNRLDAMLLNTAKKLEARTHKRLDSLTKLIEPTLMTVLAGAIGILIVALLMPIFNSAGGLQ
ncbi:MAG TPA: hypothetical protein DDW52_25895 [Planctomycetaceae bacterium]|nr:hypothetical protein [Planctomycetaceae bacterium]